MSNSSANPILRRLTGVEGESDISRKRAAESALEKPTSPLPPCGSSAGSKRQKAAPAPKKKKN